MGFSFFMNGRASKKIMIAMITKFMIADNTNPHPMIMLPSCQLAVLQFPPGMKKVMIGMITLLTSACISVVAAAPTTNAAASPMILYSLRKFPNSFSIFMCRVCL